jgi:GMP synthase PP-ATPase subunit
VSCIEDQDPSVRPATAAVGTTVVDLLANLSNRIIDEVKGVNRLVRAERVA